MNDVLTKTYYGNTLENWLIALFIIFAAVVLGRVIYWILNKRVRRDAGRQEPGVTHLLVDIFEKTITFITVLFGARYGLSTLDLPEKVDWWIGHVFQVLIILTVAWLLVRFFESIYDRYLIPMAAKTESDFDDQLLPVIRKSTKLIIWVLATIIALDNVGYDVGTLLAGLGIGGLALAMAAKDTVSNIFGGFTIFADQPFKLNDRVQVSGFDGFIREVGLRSTRLETLEGRIVTIPNAKFADSPVENVSLEPSRKVVVNLGLTYDTTPKQMSQAMDILKKIASAHPGLEEKVLIAFTEFGDFSMNLMLVYYIKPESDILGTQSDINLAILEQFNQNKLEFAFPTQTLYTKAL